MESFLKSRNLEYLLPNFICLKIDDNVASNISDHKLLEMGLVYGDLLAFKQMFTDPRSCIMKSYEQRSEELKKELKKTHVFGTDVKNRKIRVSDTYKVTFGLKCFNKRTYVAKRNKSYTTDCKRLSSYDELHNISRQFYNVSSNVKTYLSAYNGVKIESKFIHLEHYALSQKEKKKSILLYLYYPKSFGNLEFKALLKKTNLEHLDGFSSEDEDEQNYKLTEKVNNYIFSLFLYTLYTLSMCTYTFLGSLYIIYLTIARYKIKFCCKFHIQKEEKQTFLISHPHYSWSYLKHLMNLNMQNIWLA